MSAALRRTVHGRTWALLGSLAAVLVLLGCGSSSSSGGSSSATSSGGGSSQKSTKIAFFGLAAANAYTQYMYKAAQQEAAKLGIQISFVDGKFDGPTQVNEVQDALTSGTYGGFVVMPNDQTGIVPAIKQAIGKGVKVAALQFPIGRDPTKATPQVPGVTTSVIEDVVTGARVTADGINAMCKSRNPCKVGILWGSRDKVTWDGPAKRPVLVKALAPNVKIVAEADGGFLQAPGQKATADMLQAHPDLDVLATPSGDQMTLGGDRAIAAAGKKEGLANRPKGAIAVIGYGASQAGVARVQGGQWYQTYALVPQTMARKALDLLVAAMRGQAATSNGLVQTEISPIGNNITKQVLAQHPGFAGEWAG